MFSEDSFLYENKFYQSLKHSEVQFQDTSQNVIESIDPENLKWYQHFNSDLTEKINKYIEFLDIYEYPLDDFVLILMQYPYLHTSNEKFRLIREQFKYTKLDFTDIAFFYTACKYGYLKLIKRCILSSDGLEMAVRHNQVATVKFLLEQKIQITDSMLRYSAEAGYTKIVQLLLEHGANVQDDYALRHSIHKGHVKIVKLLLNHGIIIKNNQPLQWAINAGHTEIIQLLQNCQQ